MDDEDHKRYIKVNEIFNIPSILLSTTAIRNSIFTRLQEKFLWLPKPRSPMHNIRRIRYTMCQNNNTHLSLWNEIHFWNSKTNNFQKDILISPLPIHYSLRIYKWKWIESLDISLESLRLVCGRNIVNYPKHNLDFCVCLRRIYIYEMYLVRLRFWSYHFLIETL